MVETRNVMWAEWEPMTVKDRMPGMFAGTDEDDPDQGDNGIDKEDFIETT